MFAAPIFAHCNKHKGSECCASYSTQSKEVLSPRKGILAVVVGASVILERVDVLVVVVMVVVMVVVVAMLGLVLGSLLLLAVSTF